MYLPEILIISHNNNNNINNKCIQYGCCLVYYIYVLYYCGFGYILCWDFDTILLFLTILFWFKCC